jgi:catechol 2,3-dioxygenase-like lactoylglutathione lyase family enzyme
VKSSRPTSFIQHRGALSDGITADRSVTIPDFSRRPTGSGHLVIPNARQMESPLVMTSNVPAAIHGVDHVCVRVDDFERAIAWYGGKLGFTVEERWKVEQFPGVEIAFLRDQSGSHLVIIGGGEGSRYPVGPNFMEKLALRGCQHICFSSGDVDSTMADLASRGIPAAPSAMDHPEGPGTRNALVQDLEGNLIEFVGPVNSPIGMWRQSFIRQNMRSMTLRR